MPDDPATLLLAVRTGDRQAGEALARWAHKVALTYLRRMIGHQDFAGNNAEDLAQEAALNLLSWTGEVDGDLRNVLCAMAYRRATDVMRSAEFQRTRSVVEFPEVVDLNGDPVWVVLRGEAIREAARTAGELLGRLREDQARIMWLRYAEELSAAEVGERMGLSAGNVRVVLTRVRQKLGAPPVDRTPVCGTRGGYQAGCKCSRCLAANRERYWSRSQQRRLAA